MMCTIFRKRPLYLLDDRSIDYQEEDPGRHPGGRAGQTDAEVAHKMCGNLCYDHSSKQLHHAAHHGEQAKAQPLHTIPIDIDRHERQEEVLYFIGLALTSPGFWADFQSLTPAGKPGPPYETIQALAERWAGQDIA